MKNTTDMQGDGQRWRLLNMETPESVFKSRWGATDIYQHPSDSTNKFMLRIDGSWHYAHTDNVSCYCAAESFGCATGEQAYWASRVHAALQMLHSAENTLAEAHKRLGEYQNQYALALRSDTI